MEVKALTVHSQSDILATDDPFVLTPIGLVINGEPTAEEWLEVGPKLGILERSIHWAIGDWLNYGERRWGEMYARAIDETHFQYGTLRNDRWVAERIPLSRRRDKLSWTHHQAVAQLEPEKQDFWLGEAEANEWSTRDLRQAMSSHYVMDTMGSSESPEWYTPAHIVQLTLELFGEIDLDPCSNSHKVPNVPARTLYTIEDDGLAKEWHGKVYMNPPYGAEIPDWTEKLVGSYERGMVTEAIALLPGRIDTQWFQPLYDYLICNVRGRLQFVGSKSSAPFPSVVVYLGERRQEFIRTFGQIGPVVQRVD